MTWHRMPSCARKKETTASPDRQYTTIPPGHPSQTFGTDGPRPPKSEPALGNGLRWTCGEPTGFRRLEQPHLHYVVGRVWRLPQRKPAAGLSRAKDCASISLSLSLSLAGRHTGARRGEAVIQKVEVMPLVDAAARRNTRILAGLEWLAQSTSAKDVAVLFLASHGVTNSETGRYSLHRLTSGSDAGGHIDGPPSSSSARANPRPGAALS